MEEIEVKFLNIDPTQMADKLVKIGAKKAGDYFYRRQVFDYPGFTLDAQGAWLRLRDEGDKVTLGYKQRLEAKSEDGSIADGGMKEVEVVVSDFDKTKELILSLGLIEKFYQENKRTRYTKGGVEFDIDVWPELEPYIEIESDSMEKIDKAIQELGLDPAEKKIFTNHQMYKMKGIDMLDYIRVTFDGFEKRKK
ncbi:MAG: class IV adenylate cyclase [Candidatus Pacebacteria bacterium]|nr:class IV adenylate cyclase [Candidatus Paceibacterota bacterium]